MRNSITMIVFVMLVCCDNATGGGDNSTTPIETTKSNIVNPLEDPTTYKWTYVDPVEVNLDDMPFVEAFRVQHHAKGSGHTFWWRGGEYTTNLAETVSLIANGNYKWVRNSDDLDDNCTSNILDVCGVCDGNGPKTWYIDLDGDGLGDPATYTENCYYPSVDEE